MKIPASTPEQATAVLSGFAVEGRLLRLQPYSGGHINDSWLAVLAEAGGERQFLLQRINRTVFHRPEQVIENMERVTAHLAARLRAEGADVERRVLRLVRTRWGAPSRQDETGETWRLLPWIEGTRSLERARSEREAFSTALAFGHFLRQLQDLPGPRLHETIPAFHDTPGRLAAFERAVAADREGRAAGAGPEIEALLARRALAQVLADPLARGEVRERPVHNDAKISNVLFDE
ncbi:MAG TPA: phosphotransferase, partial [Vicinamibacteria bacterium]|nr:phosphotransferase [Vicinamibacteria bacterium]